MSRLVLSRKEMEWVNVGEDIRVQVVRIEGNRVRLLFEAPESVRIMRPEAVHQYANRQENAK
jgi:carbon storage regulator CsrA